MDTDFGSSLSFADGCWFYPSRGSGIWLNVGKTWKQASKDHQVALDALVMAKLNSTRLPPAFKSTRRVFESWPHRAALLGFDTAQVAFKTLAPKRHEMFSEIAVLKAPYCMSRHQSGLEPLNTCVPFLDVRVGRAPHASSSSSSKPHHACECDEKASMSLNCAARRQRHDGSDSGRLRHMGPQMRAPWNVGSGNYTAHGVK